MTNPNFLRESQHNRYDLSNDSSKLAENSIRHAIKFLDYFFNSDLHIIKEKKTYEIKTKKGLIKVESYLTEFFKSIETSCIVEVSNPLNFKGARFWTSYLGQKYWTNEKTLKEMKVNSITVFNLFAHNFDWIYNKVISVNKSINENQKINEEDIIFESDYSPKIITPNKDSVIGEVYKKVFNN